VVEGVTANRAVLVRRPDPKRQIEDLRFPSFAQRAEGLSPEQQSRLTRFHDYASRGQSSPFTKNDILIRIMNEIRKCPKRCRAGACHGLGRPKGRPYIRIGTPAEILVEDR